MTFCIVLLPTLLGFIYPDVSVWLGMIGAFTGVFLAFTIPGLIYYTMFRNDKVHRISLIIISIFSVLITIVGILCAIVCALYALGIVHGDDST